MKRNPCQSPVRRDPSNGKVASGKADYLTRSRVVPGRPRVSISLSKSAMAVRAKATTATGSEVLESDDLTRSGFAEPLLRAIQSAWDRIQQRGHRGGIRIRLIEGSRQERSGERARADIGPRGEAGQLGGMFVVKHDIHSVRAIRHFSPHTH